MLSNEKNRGIEIARMSSKKRSDLIAQLMFGRGAERARLNFVMLMTMWGIGPLGNGLLNKIFIGTLFTKKTNRDALTLNLK